MPDTHRIQPVIMSGGTGQRMWPISRRAKPKQFQRLTGDQSLFQETVLRVQGDGFSPPIILGAAAHERMIIEELNEIGVAPSRLILEPAPKNTAPAIAAACLMQQQKDPQCLLAILPADHLIPDRQAFQSLLHQGAEQAAAGLIMTFGIAPTAPETGYGYIKAGTALDSNAFTVQSFEEKPDLETAKRYLGARDYYWNAGIFLFRPDIMIEEMNRHCSDILGCVCAAVTASEDKVGRVLIDPERFLQSPENSIDYAVMEHTDKAGLIAANIAWSDIGSWSALWEMGARDAADNYDPHNAALMLDSKGTLAFSTKAKIVAIGVEDLVIVAADDAVLITKKAHAQEIKRAVSRLKDDGEDHLL